MFEEGGAMWIGSTICTLAAIAIMTYIISGWVLVIFGPKRIRGKDVLGVIRNIKRSENISVVISQIVNIVRIVVALSVIFGYGSLLSLIVISAIAELIFHLKTKILKEYPIDGFNAIFLAFTLVLTGTFFYQSAKEIVEGII